MEKCLVSGGASQIWDHTLATPLILFYIGSALSFFFVTTQILRKLRNFCCRASSHPSSWVWSAQGKLTTAFTTAVLVCNGIMLRRNRHPNIDQCVNFISCEVFATHSMKFMSSEWMLLKSGKMVRPVLTIPLNRKRVYKRRTHIMFQKVSAICMPVNSSENCLSQSGHLAFSQETQCAVALYVTVNWGWIKSWSLRLRRHWTSINCDY